ncbi:MAG: CHASE2 domain-containing protein, partial [Verrucomicrobia bacterium]|nr:CHASE2 domain-containing protein [Leptolyngbya sp. ES-bin-22]
MTTQLPHPLSTRLTIRFTPSINKLWQQFLPGAIAALLLMGLLRLGIGQSLENLVYDTLFQLRGAIPWSEEVVVIEIDELSLREMGQFPWERDRYTTLLNWLEPAEPKVVALNVLLSEPDAGDQKLAAAIQRLGCVVLAQSWDDTGATLLPAPLLRAAAAASGHAYQQADLDGLVRQIDLQRQGVPAFSLAAFSVYGGVYPAVPPNVDHSLWINWLGASHRATHYSYRDVVNGQVSPRAFRNKIVLLGVTTGALDSLQTPFDRNSPTSSVYLQATVISNLLQQNALHRPSRGWMVLLLLVGGPGLSFFLTRWRFERRLLAWLVLCLGWVLLGIGLFHLRSWIPIATPLMLFSLTGAVVAVREQARTNALLRQSEERYALAVRGSNEGLWDWNLKTDEVYYSPRWKEMLGLQDDAFSDRLQFWYDRVHPDDLESLKATLTDHLYAQTAHFEHEHRMMHHDGTYHWMLSRGVAVQNRDGTAYRMAGSQTDITKRKRAEAQLWRNAYYDELTGLPNRAFFLDRLRQAIAHAAEHPLYFYAVLLLDLDRFQVVNNSLGNAIGDQLLIAFAHRIKGFLPAEAVLARLPGDEFAILLNNIEDVRDASRMAEQLQQILALPFNLDSQEVYITASTGIAVGSTRYAQPEHLLQDADTALHRAKAAGKNRHQVFEPTMHNRMLAKLKLENDLRRAISLEHRANLDDPEDDRQELLLYYQPIVQLTTGK